jgi:putative oxidoreductase
MIRKNCNRPDLIRIEIQIESGGILTMRKLTDPLARILISSVFLITGVMKLQHISGTTAALAAKGIPMASLATYVVILIELGGGISVILGMKTRFVAAIQFIYLIPVTLLYHNFWAAPPEMHQMQLINFGKNLAIMGGLLILVARGAGHSSVDGAA